MQAGETTLEPPIRVLLVEDDDDLASALRASLTSCATAVNFQVTPSPTLRAALDALERASFDAVLLDLGLPDSRGLQTFARVHAAAPTVPIVVLTGDADEALAMRAASAGAQDYLVKGHVDEQMLVRSVRYAIERKRAEEALRSSEERLRLALGAASMGIWEWSVVDDQLTISPAFLGQIGVEAPRSFADLVRLVHEDDRELVASLAANLRGAAPATERFEATFRLGRRATWVRCKGQLVPGRGRPQVNGTIMDTTEQKELEAKLLQSQKLESIGRLAGGVAHDFNNLLTVILGSVYLAGQHPAVATSAAHAHLENVREAAERASQLTARLLAFARKQVLQLRSLDLGEIVADTEVMLRRLLGEDVALTTHIAPDVAAVRADRTQLEQVLMNLAVNARDAMPDGGTLRLTVENLPAAEAPERPGQPREEYVRLTVTDTGVGMSPAVLEHVFEPFFTTKPEGKGTGLGLATCYGIVTQLGGHIAVSSAPDLGSTFTVLLPRAHARPDPAAPGLGTAGGGRETVLLVEDDPMVRTLATTALKMHGYQVIAVGAPEQALVIARDDPRPIDLLLTDMVMPGMDGRRLAAEVLRLRPVAVLFCSGYSPESLEGTRFIQKPFSPLALARAVREALDAARAS
jgi:signal transduction histidine kinase